MKVVWRQHTLNDTSHFTICHSKFVIKNISTLVYLEENLNLKNELLKYYFCEIKDFIIKNHIWRYIENFGHQNPSKKPSLLSMLPHHITIDLLFIKKHYVKVHGVHIHWLWIVTSFWVLLWKSIMLWLLRNYPWNSYNVIILYITL
jgi:hypothetical protein